MAVPSRNVMPFAGSGRARFVLGTRRVMMRITVVVLALLLTARWSAPLGPDSLRLVI